MMTQHDLALLLCVLAAVFMAAAVCVLPGFLLQIVALYGRLRGRNVPMPRMLGPLFAYELTRLARRGLLPWLRAVYVGILLVALFLTYLSEFREFNIIELIVGTGEALPLDRSAHFAEKFAESFLICQLFATLLITPIFAGGGITEEKDRRTLEHLQLSLLSNREIIAGILTARLVFIIGLILTGLPVLALTMLFGGVDSPILVVGFVAAAMSALSFGAFSVWLATRRETLREVLFYSYLWAVLLGVLGGCCGSCFGPLNLLSPVPVLFNAIARSGRVGAEEMLIYSLSGFIVSHGVAALLFVLLAKGNIRGTVPTMARPRPLADNDQPRVRVLRARRMTHVPRLGPHDPFWWKERYFVGRLPGIDRELLGGCGVALLLVFALPLVIGLVSIAIEELASRQGRGRFTADVVAMAAAGISIIGGTWISIGTLSSVARERQRQTLDTLLTLPVDRVELLWAKWYSPIDRAKGWLWGILAFVFLAVLMGAVHPLPTVMAVLLIAGWLLFLNSLALWLSVKCKTVGRAAAVYTVVVLVLLIGPFLGEMLMRSVVSLLVSPEMGDVAGQAVRFICVPGACRRLFVSWPDWSLGDDVIATAPFAAAVCAGLYLLASRVFWRLAIRRFEAEGR